MFNDVIVYLRKCEHFQKHKSLKTTIKNKLLRILEYQIFMKQIGIGLCSLSEFDCFCHLFDCVDYFSKWTEGKK